MCCAAGIFQITACTRFVVNCGITDSDSRSQIDPYRPLSRVCVCVCKCECVIITGCTCTTYSVERFQRRRRTFAPSSIFVGALSRKMPFRRFSAGTRKSPTNNNVRYCTYNTVINTVLSALTDCNFLATFM